MMAFDFVNLTRIIFGEGKLDTVGAVLKSYGFKRVLLVYGGGSIKKNGAYDRLVKSLNEEGILFEELSGIKANPDLSFVVEGLEKLRKTPVDCILAVGGGSVIDVSKSLAVNFYHEGDPYAFNAHTETPKKALPVGVVLTLASAGSESSDSCVISDYKTNRKSGFNSPLNRPLFAIEEPSLTLSAPLFQKTCGIVDMMMHTIERYFYPTGSFTLTDRWALDLIREVRDNALRLMGKPTDPKTHGNLMLLSSLAHDGLTSLGKSGAFSVHPLEHALSAYRPEIAHGAGIAVCFLGWAKYVYTKDLLKFATLARSIFDIKEESDQKASIMGIEAMACFYQTLHMPTTFEELGLGEEDIPALANIATGNGTRVIGRCPQSLDIEDVKAIYRLCLQK